MKVLSIFKIQKERIKYYKNQFLVNVLLSFFGVFVEISLLQIFAGETIQITVYVLLSTLIFTSLATNKIPEYCQAIKKGEVIRYYIRPLNFFHYVLIEEIGNSFLNFMQMFPLFIVAVLFQKPTLLVMLFFMFTLFLSIILASLITVSVFSLSLVLSNFVATKALLTCISGFFSGGMIPLTMLPDFFKEISYKTPFAYLIDGPIKVFHNTEIGEVIFFQFLWILVFYSVGYIFFHYFEKKITVFGG